MAEHEHEHEHVHDESCPPSHGHSHRVSAKPIVTGAVIALVALMLLAAVLACVALFLRGRGGRFACPACRRFVSPKEGRCPLCGGEMEGGRGPD